MTVASFARLSNTPNTVKTHARAIDRKFRVSDASSVIRGQGGQVMRLMRDSTNLNDIPIDGTDLVAGYVNGLFVATKEDFARFHGIPHVHIDALGTDPQDAGVLDFEACNLGIADTCVTWVKRRKAAFPNHYPPVLYCSRSQRTPLFNAMNAAGLEIVKDFRFLIATLDGTKMVADMTGVTAVQFAGESMTGGHYNESIVFDDDWHRVP